MYPNSLIQRFTQKIKGMQLNYSHQAEQDDQPEKPVNQYDYGSMYNQESQGEENDPNDKSIQQVANSDGDKSNEQQNLSKVINVNSNNIRPTARKAVQISQKNEQENDIGEGKQEKKNQMFFYQEQTKRKFVSNVLEKVKDKSEDQRYTILKDCSKQMGIDNFQAKIWVISYKIVFQIQQKLKNDQTQNSKKILDHIIIKLKLFVKKNPTEKKYLIMRIVKTIFQAFKIQGTNYSQLYKTKLQSLTQKKSQKSKPKTKQKIIQKKPIDITSTPSKSSSESPENAQPSSGSDFQNNSKGKKKNKTKSLKKKSMLSNTQVKSKLISKTEKANDDKNVITDKKVEEKKVSIQPQPYKKWVQQQFIQNQQNDLNPDPNSFYNKDGLEYFDDMEDKPEPEQKIATTKRQRKQIKKIQKQQNNKRVGFSEDVQKYLEMAERISEQNKQQEKNNQQKLNTKKQPNLNILTSEMRDEIEKYPPGFRTKVAEKLNRAFQKTFNLFIHENAEQLCLEEAIVKEIFIKHGSYPLFKEQTNIGRANSSQIIPKQLKIKNSPSYNNTVDKRKSNNYLLPQQLCNESVEKHVPPKIGEKFTINSIPSEPINFNSRSNLRTIQTNVDQQKIPPNQLKNSITQPGIHIRPVLQTKNPFEQLQLKMRGYLSQNQKISKGQFDRQLLKQVDQINFQGSVKGPILANWSAKFMIKYAPYLMARPTNIMGQNRPLQNNQRQQMNNFHVKIGQQKSITNPPFRIPMNQTNLFKQRLNPNLYRDGTQKQKPINYSQQGPSPLKDYGNGNSQYNTFKQRFLNQQQPHLKPPILKK